MIIPGFSNANANTNATTVIQFPRFFENSKNSKNMVTQLYTLESHNCKSDLNRTNSDMLIISHKYIIYNIIQKPKVISLPLIKS